MGYDSTAAGAQRFSPFHLTTGRWATGPGPGRDRRRHGARPSTTTSASRSRSRPRGRCAGSRVVGVARSARVESIGTATAAIFSLPTAQKMFGKVGRYDDVLVAAKPGVSAAALRQRAARVAAAPRSACARRQTDDRFTLDGLRQFISFIKVFLLVFAVVALVVGAFTIFNTLSITVAQRTRELAHAADRRRVAPPGAVVGRGRDADARRRRLGDRRRRRPRAGQRPARAAEVARGIDLPRVAHGVRPAHGRRSA